MLPQWVIEKKRDGGELSAEEIRWFINGFTTGEIPDYQMSALAMAIFIRGMSDAETAALTEAMMRSGDMLDTSGIPGFKVDKHSTGGIGDKTSLILAPLVASCGLAVPMISGRGLGITGGTLDKLESIPGYRINLSEREMLDVVAKCGCSIIGQTARLAPADRKLYALRDVTATVPCIPLITASIMCKKLCEGIDGLVLDVKVGSGAFMKDFASAKALAESMIRAGQRMNKRMGVLFTDMNEPLGREIGNACEVLESVLCLRGEGPADLRELTIRLCIRMLLLAEKARDAKDARKQLETNLDNGKALAVFRRMVELHGGDVRVIDAPEKLARPAVTMQIAAPKAGYLTRVDAEKLGRATLLLGAGRLKTTDTIDFGAGITLLAVSGDQVRAGQPLLTVGAATQAKLDAARSLCESALEIGAQKPAPRTLVIEER